ncbi:MAG: hypothetical protein WA188_09050 [Terriglobales bacterium]
MNIVRMTATPVRFAARNELRGVRLWKRLSVVAFALLASLAVAQTQPELQTTIDFMSQMVQTEQRSMTMNRRCEILVVYYGRLLSSVGLESQHDVLIFSDPDPDDGELPTYARFNLGDIDPHSIDSKDGGFSAEYFERFLKLYPECGKGGAADQRCERSRLFWFDPKKSDMAVVSFRTTDLKPVIERGELKKLGDNCQENLKIGGVCPRYTFGVTPRDHYPKRSVAKTALFFQDKDRAERFVTAFVHAVKLCGSRENTFGPTRERER